MVQADQWDVKGMKGEEREKERERDQGRAEFGRRVRLGRRSTFIYVLFTQ